MGRRTVWFRDSNYDWPIALVEPSHTEVHYFSKADRRDEFDPIAADLVELARPLLPTD